MLAAVLLAALEETLETAEVPLVTTPVVARGKADELLLLMMLDGSDDAKEPLPIPLAEVTPEADGLLVEVTELDALVAAALLYWRKYCLCQYRSNTGGERSATAHKAD